MSYSFITPVSKNHSEKRRKCFCFKGSESRQHVGFRWRISCMFLTKTTKQKSKWNSYNPKSSQPRTSSFALKSGRAPCKTKYLLSVGSLGVGTLSLEWGWKLNWTDLSQRERQAMSPLTFGNVEVGLGHDTIFRGCHSGPVFTPSLYLPPCSLYD